MGSKIGYWLLLGTCKAVGSLPRWFLYGPFHSFVYFLVYKAAGYRVAVVRKNLRESFPQKNEKELLDIEKKFYRHLAEVMINSVDISAISAKKAAKRMVYLNLDEVEQKMRGKDWIAALAHYGSWEYFYIYQILATQQLVGIYKPLHSKPFDMYYNYMRKRFGMTPVPMKDLLRYLISERKEGRTDHVYGLIADQTPAPNEPPHWFDFLGRKTAFFMGIEKLALKFRMPVWYVHIEKVKKAHYVSRLELIYDGEETVPEGEITRRYISNLEQQINERPELWTWSHKRWKHKYPDEKDTGSHS